MAAIKNIINKVTGGSSLPTVTLGKGGPQVTRMGIGLMGLSAFYGKPKPDEERLKFLDTLYDEGELFWDSADMYMDNEDLLGYVQSYAKSNGSVDRRVRHCLTGHD